MRGFFLKCLGLAAVVAAAAIPLKGTSAADATPGFIAVGAETLVPFGWQDFCQRYAGECADQDLEARDVAYSPETMALVRKVNSWVNTHVTGMTDMEHWGVVDRWDYPTDGFGDCEDYALLKRRMLIDQGFPRQALLMTIVRDADGEGHAVLTVKTNRGEYILDNLNPAVRGWSDTHYTFVKRQSQANESRWISLGEPPRLVAAR